MSGMSEGPHPALPPRGKSGRGRSDGRPRSAVEWGRGTGVTVNAIRGPASSSRTDLTLGCAQGVARARNLMGRTQILKRFAASKASSERRVYSVRRTAGRS